MHSLYNYYWNSYFNFRLKLKTRSIDLKNLINVIILTPIVWGKRTNHVYVLENKTHRCWDFPIETKVREKIKDVWDGARTSRGTVV